MEGVTAFAWRFHSTMLSALRLVVLRARQDTRAFFGWNYGTLSVPVATVLAVVVATFPYYGV